MLTRDFFKHDLLTCARELVGCELVWGKCAGIVVETEAYAAVGDEACHTFARPSAREFVAKHRAGAAYVYLNYGMYWLLNVLVKGGSEEGFVLIRAIQPTRGLDAMRLRREGNSKFKIQNSKSLCSGPGKLAQGLGVTGTHHGTDLCKNPARSFFPRKNSTEVVADVRIGISKATHLPWRFLLRNSPFVSAALAPRKK